MVAASPSGVAAVLSLGTYLIPFNNTSGSFLDLIGSELYLHSRVRRLLPAAAFPKALVEGWHSPRRGMTRGGEEDGARVAGAAFGLRPRARKLAGGPPGEGGARERESGSKGQAARRLALMVEI